MAISKLNAEQTSVQSANFNGILFVYNGKDGANTALHFLGKDFEATEKTQNAMFEVIKNVVNTFWSVKEKETDLREGADGIRSKLRASTPAEIIIRTAKGELVKKFDLTDSVWARLGLVPTKKDMERSARDKKKAIHNAAKAICEAMNFRVELPKEDKTEQPADKSVETDLNKSAQVNKKEEKKEEKNAEQPLVKAA